jgi:hypothetical protein
MAENITEVPLVIGVPVPPLFKPVPGTVAATTTGL